MRENRDRIKDGASQRVAERGHQYIAAAAAAAEIHVISYHYLLHLVLA